MHPCIHNKDKSDSLKLKDVHGLQGTQQGDCQRQVSNPYS